MPDPRSVRLIAQDVKERAGRLIGRLSQAKSWDEMQTEVRELAGLVQGLATAVEELDSPPTSPTPLRPI
jgi:hypothetical protein